MKVNPQQAPLYGQCVFTVQLDDGDVRRADGGEEEEEEEFYLLFSGSTQTHVTSTLRTSHVTLQAVCPAHDVCEQVLVTLCLAGGPVGTHSSEPFCFVQDLALDMAHFLLDDTAPQEALLLDDEQIPLKECERLDESLALALKHLARPPTHTHTDVDRQMATPLDSCNAVSPLPHLPALLALAAGHGLWKVAWFLLQQPGALQALRTPNAQGLSPACLAQSRGHTQLLELFTQYETSSNVQVEPKEQQLHFYPEGRVFQHHVNLGTFTLTFPSQREQNGEACCLQELRRLIHLHRDTKRNPDCAGTIPLTHSSPAFGLQRFSNGQPEKQQEGAAEVTLENCSTTPEEQGSPSSLEERTQGEEPAGVTHTSCTSGTLCQSQEAGGGLKATPAAANSSSSGRNRKNKKKTTKSTRQAEDSPGNNRGSAPEAGRGTAPRPPTKTTGSTTHDKDGSTISPRECSHPGTELETPSPIKPVCASGADGKCAADRKGVALPTTATVVEKQEGEKWEVDTLICERADTGSVPAKEAILNRAPGTATERTVTMGQEQSQDPQESKSDLEEPCQPDTTSQIPPSGRRTIPMSPGMDIKPRRRLWRDGGWMGVGSPPDAPETVAAAKSVWYGGENLNQGANKDWDDRETVNSQSVWYDDSDIMDQRKLEQPEKECDPSTPRASGLSCPLQLLEQGLSSHQLSTALSQPHAAGAQPAPSHGEPATAQRREVHGSQEEVEPDWREGRVEGEEQLSHTETTHSRKSSETADVEEGGEEKQGSEEKGAKGKKKRRKKRGKKAAGTEAKLSSSSSVESQSQLEIPVANPNNSQESQEAKDNKTGSGNVQSATAASEPTRREEAAAEGDGNMHLPIRTEGQTRDAHGSDCDGSNLDLSYAPAEFSPTDQGRTDLTLETKELSGDESIHFNGPGDFNPHSTVTDSELNITKADIKDITTIGKEVPEPPPERELKGHATPIQQTLDVDVDLKALSEKGDCTVAAGGDVASVDRTGLVESDCPRELPVKHSDPEELTEDLFLLEFPEQNTQHVQSVDSDTPVQPQDPVGSSLEPMESVHRTETGCSSFEGTADVSTLRKGVRRAETTLSEYSEHRLSSEMHEEEKNYTEDLVATALAVVTVAIASAMASIELSQELDDKQSGGQESASKEPENPPSLAQDANVATDTVDQLADNLLNTVQPMQLSAQLMNKESCQLLAVTPAEAENQPVEYSHTDSTEEKANVILSEVLQCNTEREKPSVTELSSSQQANLDLAALGDSLSLLLLDKQDIQTESTQNKLFTSLPEGEDNLLQASVNHLPESNVKIETKVVSQGEIQTDNKLQEEESQLPCPVVDTGQNPECRSPQDQSICPKESGAQAEGDGQQIDVHLQHNQTHGTEDSHSVKAIPAEGQVGRQCKASESCGKGLVDVSEPLSQAKEREKDQQLGGPVTTPCEGERISCGSTLPVTPCDWTPVTDPRPEEPTVPVNAKTDLYQSSSDTELDPAICVDNHSDTFNGHESVDSEAGVLKGLDKDTETLDTVDRWTVSERNTMKSDEEAVKEMSTVEDTCQTEAQCRQTERDEDSTPIVQIQRESDVCYPVQPCPDAHTLTTCTDVHPDRAECLSVCVLDADKDSPKVCAKVDDSVFKKPEDPPPRSRHRDRGTHSSRSSTDEAHTHGAFRPSEGAVSAGTPHAVAPQSARLAWKSETEDRGGEEEERKDQLSEKPVCSAVLRASIRSLSPFRRHSWEPGRDNAAPEAPERSSLKSQSGEARTAKPPLHRRSMSWCPSNLSQPKQETIDGRSYSLERLEEKGVCQAQCEGQRDKPGARALRLDNQDRGSLLSLTEEEQEGDASTTNSQSCHQVLSGTISCPSMFSHQTLTKSISMVAISHRDLDGVSSFSSNSGSLDYSISEEEPGPLRSDAEGKGGPKISRTFSYLRSKMSKKGKEKEKERKGEKERESKEREKKSANGHVFIPVSASPASVCQHCTKHLHNKEALLCNSCGVQVHKSCRESLPVCTKSKTKSLGPEAVPGSAVNMRTKSTSSASSVSSTSSSSSRERWSTATSPDDHILPVLAPRRHPSFFNTHSNLAKSISTSNIAGLDEVQLKGLKFLSQSTDSLNHGGKVDASTESLTDEGTEMMDSQLMGEFEWDVKDLEADSWSGTVDKKFLKGLKKDEIKRQDVIYELYQTEFHHVRTLKIMSEVYYKGLQKELQLDTHTLDKIFPVLDDLLDTHTHLLTQLLERKRASSAEGQNNNSFLICSIGDVLVNQFSGCSADRMKKTYGKFCSRHNEAVNLYKDLHAKDKRFQAYIKRIMSSSIVRRLSIPECILLVTQRITKYPVLIQRILQHTKDSDEDHGCVCEALRCVKELITAVDSKVNEQEKKHRLREVYSRTDSKSIMRMKSGQMFAKEDLIRGRKLLHDGALQLKNTAGRLKEVQAMLLSDVLVFLQEKDQKYAFASLDQRSTVISLQNLIVREVANEERGLFLITAGIERPEMVEVLASSKEERNTWRAIIQDAMQRMEKEEDEGVPSETEEDKRQQENRAKEIRELLRRKDEQIICLLEEKVHIFRDLSECSPAPDDTHPPIRERMLFRATPEDVTKGEPIIKDALREVESLHVLVNNGVGGAGCSVPVDLTGGSVGPVCLPRRAETFGGFDSHQMSASKGGEKEEGDESLDLRRTESDSVLKKGATASLQMMLKRNNEQVQRSVTHLHDLLISLQAVVVQQDSFIEEQRQAVCERLTASSSRHSSSSSLSSSSSSRPSSLIEQEKHRSLERQRQEAASLQKQQAAHAEEKRRREKAWELQERSLHDREDRLRQQEEDSSRRRQELAEDRDTLQRRREDYHKDMERLRDNQRKVERDREQLRRDTDRLEAMKTEQCQQLERFQRTPSTTSEESIRFPSTSSLDLDSKEAAEKLKEVELSSSAPTKEPFLRIGSKRMGKSFNPFSSSSSKAQAAERESQPSSRLLQLAKPKDKKDKKKKKAKAGEHTQKESTVMSDPQNDGDIFFC